MRIASLFLLVVAASTHQLGPFGNVIASARTSAIRLRFVKRGSEDEIFPSQLPCGGKKARGGSPASRIR